MNVSHRKISMFRCYRPPLIGPKVDQAFVPKDKGLEAELCEYGIWVKEIHSGTEHMVPYSNIESIRFEKEEASVTNIDQVKRGRPWPKKDQPNGAV